MKICSVCGREFEPRNCMQHRCSQCVPLYCRRRRKAKKSTEERIAENERAAREAGISYGKLVTMRWLAKQRKAGAR